MRFVLCAVAFVVFFSSAANATKYFIKVTGTLVSQSNPGSDPNLAVGDTVTLTARFGDASFTEWGSNGYKIAGLYGLPTSGDDYFRIDAPGITWVSTDHVNDFQPFYFEDDGGAGKQLGYPAIIFNDSQVLGLAGTLTISSQSTRPIIELGSSPGNGLRDLNPLSPGYGFEFFDPATTSTSFEIVAPDGLYNNFYATPGFEGVWDFDASIVQSVPEPASWALMMAGFGLVGGAVRRTARGLRPEVA